ncbi:MAG: hypothetical protein ABL895_16560 [Cyclobacteriaceae bacterium]
MYKRGLSIILAIVILGVGTGLLFYKVFIPSYVADVITRDTLPSYIPEKYKNQVERIQKPLNKYSEEVFRITDSLDLSLELVLKIIDNVNPDDVLKVYSSLENKTVDNSEDVFQLIFENIEIREIDISLYKGIFLKYATPARINRAMRYAEKHELVVNLAPSTAKKIAKQMVIKHYNKEKISKEDLKIL